MPTPDPTSKALCAADEREREAAQRARSFKSEPPLMALSAANTVTVSQKDTASEEALICAREIQRQASERLVFEQRLAGGAIDPQLGEAQRILYVDGNLKCPAATPSAAVEVARALAKRDADAEEQESRITELSKALRALLGREDLVQTAPEWGLARVALGLGPAVARAELFFRPTSDHYRRANNFLKACLGGGASYAAAQDSLARRLADLEGQVAGLESELEDARVAIQAEAECPCEPGVTIDKGGHYVTTCPFWRAQTPESER